MPEPILKIPPQPYNVVPRPTFALTYTAPSGEKVDIEIFPHGERDAACHLADRLNSSYYSGYFSGRSEAQEAAKASVGGELLAIADQLKDAQHPLSQAIAIIENGEDGRPETRPEPEPVAANDDASYPF